jgi:hypothetical protein
MRTTRRKTALPLAKGQLWKIDDAYIQIVEHGKRLIHYKMMKNVGQRGVFTHMSAVTALEDYLKANQARLVKAGSGA